ncbi:MAG: DUF1365 domain-containing protein [Alphaproteobacteria bacterium]|nr:DUF1365 domain-containing protein [Alphaproteobacteria bacterium]
MQQVKKNCLYVGSVFHKRHKPFTHSFKYRVFSLFCDIEEMPALSDSLRLFSYNKFNLMGFYDKDHGPRNGDNLYKWIVDIANGRNIDINGGKIYFLGFPRILGYVFNPISLYFLYDKKHTLQAVLYQVKNTFGEQHCYLAPLETPGKIDKHAHQKMFHVSPFMEMDAEYNFSLQEPDENLSFAIHQFDRTGKILTATWDGKKTPLTDKAILKTFITHPLLTLKIIAGIHWEALRLWLKGAKYIPKPHQKEQDIT